MTIVRSRHRMVKQTPSQKEQQQSVPARCSYHHYLFLPVFLLVLIIISSICTFTFYNDIDDNVRPSNNKINVAIMVNVDESEDNNFLKFSNHDDCRTKTLEKNHRYNVDTSACQLLRSTPTSDSYLLHPINTKLLYVRNAKCSSKEITASLQKRFGKLKRWNDLDHIPDDYVVFTFVRNPMSMAISAYGEILKNYVWKQIGPIPRPNFVHQLLELEEINNNNNSSNNTLKNTIFHTYLDELFSGRLGDNIESNYFPGHGYPSATRLSKYIHRINYIGHMELNKKKT